MFSDFDLLAQLQKQLSSLQPGTIAMLVVILFMYLFLSPRQIRKYRKKWRGNAQRNTSDSSTKQGNYPPNMANPKNQMDAIAAVEFETCRLLNKEESRVLPVLERAATKANQGHRVMAQTSLGEVLRPKKGSTDREANRRAFASINSKRLDFAVINRLGILVCAVEYQGSGHYRSGTFMRDAVKREVLRKAGVPFLEVAPDFIPEELERQLLKSISPIQPQE